MDGRKWKKIAGLIDSDVLLYKNISEIDMKDYWALYSVTLPNSEEHDDWVGSVHNSIWTYEGITKFCQFMIDFYKTPTNVERLR